MHEQRTISYAKAPLRLGLAGGGTDVTPYCDQYGGQIVNATISLYTRCQIQRIKGHQAIFAASDYGVRDEISQEQWGTHQKNQASVQAEHQEGLMLHKAVYSRIMRDFNRGEFLPLSILTYSDAPPGSGVGSSSALVVSMVAAYCELLDLAMGEYEIARLSYQIERIDCGLAGGKQDQYAATFGGFNHMEFFGNEHVIVNPIRMRRECINELESKLLLYYTGKSRESAKIIESQIAATSQKDSNELKAMHQIRADAIRMKHLLMRGRIDPVLDLIGSSWMAKRQAAQGISNASIEEISERALKAGATSMKISGAGGGGFMIIAVQPAQRLQVVRALEAGTGRFYDFCFVKNGVESWSK
jgi:D-glycero-alpha-D-manno-heptose-7-phosphate kinase